MVSEDQQASGTHVLSSEEGETHQDGERKPVSEALTSC